MSERRLVLAGSLLAAAVMWSPAFFRPFATGFGDWQFFHHLWEAGWVAATRFGEWPLWDPYHCGGITIFGNPQSQHFSPLYWLSLPLGPTLASKLFLVLHAAIGFAGMYALARRDYGISAAGSALASLAWAGSGFFASHGGGGHSAFLPFYFAPLVLLLGRRSVADPRAAVGLAAVLALVLLEGGVYPFPYFLLLLAGAALATMGATRAAWPVVRAAALTLVLTALLGAIRLLPILDELRRHPRTVDGGDGVTLAELVQMLTVRDRPWDDRTWGSGDHRFVWAEYGSYVGWAVLGAALVGFVACLRGRRWGLVAGVLGSLALTLGDHGVASPWSLLHRLPIYDSLRVPSRFAVLLTLFLALAAGVGLDRLVRRSGPRRALLAGLVLAGVAFDFAVVHRPVVDRWRSPATPIGPVHERFHLTRAYPYEESFASFPRMNLGTRQCYEAMRIPIASGLWAGDRPQARALGAGGRVGAWGRTANRAWAEVELAAPGRVLFNQNHAPGWRAAVGTVVEHAGMLAVDAPAGRHRIEVVYRPPTLGPALGASLLGVALCGLVLRRAADRPRESSGRAPGRRSLE